MLQIHRGQMTYVLAAAMLTGPAAFALLFTGVYLAEDASTVAIASQMGVPFSTLLSVWLLGEIDTLAPHAGHHARLRGMVIISFDPRVFDYWEGLALVVASCFIVIARTDLREALEGHSSAGTAGVDRRQSAARC